MRKPEIGKAPGLVWRWRKSGKIEARWQARTDLVKRGWRPKSVGLWIGDTLDEDIAAYIRSRCDAIQTEMLAWGGMGGVYVPSTVYDRQTLRSLIDVYQTDPDSPFHKLRHSSLRQRVKMLARLRDERGDTVLPELRPREFHRWYEGWSEGGKLAMGHAMMTIVRILFSFGSSILECPECERLHAKLHLMKFKNSAPRDVRLTVDHVIAIRAEAHRRGFQSIAKAQALQFDCMLRQKDVIGEWEPMDEPTPSYVHHNGQKWVRGLRGEEIDASLILRHVTSKRNKLVEVPLRHAPMVLEEFTAGFPASGPLVICELTGRPWRAATFADKWREIATAAGVPKYVRNMDSRAGAITEATEAGAELEHIKHAATHSDISMTQRYSRGAAEKTAGVLIRRVEFRNKK